MNRGGGPATMRSRVLRFNRPLNIEEQDRINGCLLEAGLPAAQFVEKACTIQYPFPERSLAMLRGVFAAQLPALRLETGLFDALTMLLENNERSQSNHCGGWTHELEDVYVRYFEPYSFNRDNLRRQTWRKYKDS